MNRAVLKPILIGFFLAAALFMMPFFIAKAIIFFLVMGALFKFLRSRRLRRNNHHELHPAVADVIRYMSEQEYTIYRQKLEAHYYGHNTKKEQVIEID
jgi:hypothetical protein